MAFDHARFARNLSQRLNTDPEFRNKLQEDPKSALAEYGLEIDDKKAALIRESLAAGLEGVGDGDKVAAFIIPV